MKIADQIRMMVKEVARLLPKLMNPDKWAPFVIQIESHRQGRIKLTCYQKTNYDEIVQEEQYIGSMGIQDHKPADLRGKKSYNVLQMDR